MRHTRLCHEVATSRRGILCQDFDRNPEGMTGRKNAPARSDTTTSADDASAIVSAASGGTFRIARACRYVHSRTPIPPKLIGMSVISVISGNRAVKAIASTGYPAATETWRNNHRTRAELKKEIPAT